MNSHSEQMPLHSAGLSIDPAAGQVCAGAECVRLGPVNMKVLMLLLESSNRVVGRNEFFDKVWARQLVSDDVLTRSISDLRTQLGAHADTEILIETIPKRGYRWVPPVLCAPEGESIPVRLPERQVASAAGNQGMRIFAVVIALVAALVVLSGIVPWASDDYAVPQRIKVAAMPIQASAEQQQAATEFDRLLQQELLASTRFELLSFSATSRHLQNPFPVLAREYGVEYILEGRIQTWQSEAIITLDLVDARSASVMDSVTATIGNPADAQRLSGSIIARFGEGLNAL